MADFTYYGVRFGVWTPARNCTLEPREMRRVVSEFNDTFGNDNNRTAYIVSGMKGYKLTRDLKEIRAQIEHDIAAIHCRSDVVYERRRKLERLERVMRHMGELV